MFPGRSSALRRLPASFISRKKRRQTVPDAFPVLGNFLLRHIFIGTSQIRDHYVNGNCAGIWNGASQTVEFWHDQSVAFAYRRQGLGQPWAGAVASLAYNF